MDLGINTSWNMTPSTRVRIRIIRSSGSKWMSLTPPLIARWMMRLTSPDHQRASSGLPLPSASAPLPNTGADSRAVSSMIFFYGLLDRVTN